MILEKRDPRAEFGAAVTEIAAQDDRVVVLSADSGGSSGFGKFAEQYPERYFECGIMEQTTVGMAAGMSTAGKIPVFCAIAPFVTARPFEMVRNDVGYMHQNVKIVGRNGGMTYSDLGATHHSLEDFAIMRMIPGMTVLAPQDVSEIISAVKAMLEYEGPVYMRIGSEKQQDIIQDRKFIIGQGYVIKEGTDLTVITTGTVTRNTLEAADKLEKTGISVEVLGMPTVWPLDERLVLSSVKKTKRVVTVEEHYVYGGLGGAVAELCAEKLCVPVKRIGVPHVYVTTGPYPELLKKYGLDKEGIYRSICDFMKTSKRG